MVQPPFVRYLIEFIFIFCLVQFLYSHLVQSPPEKSHQTSLHSDKNDVKSDSKEAFIAERNMVARELFSKVRVLCWIMTGPRNHWTKARHVKATWGRRCNVLLFFSSEIDDNLPTIKLHSTVEGHHSLWGKTREGFRYVWEHYRDQADWFMKADDDSFIILENLRYHLSAYNASEPIHFGHKFRQFVQTGYMQGGSGYVLSKEALRRFVEIGLNDSNLCRQDQGGAEDVEIGWCMQQLGCSGVDTRDSHGRHRYLPLPLETHLTMGPLSKEMWFWWYTYYPTAHKIRRDGSGLEWDCCSDTAIGFHKVKPMDMYVYQYLIYILKPFGVTNIRHRLQATPFPPPDARLEAMPMTDPTDQDQAVFLHWQQHEDGITKP